MMSLDISPIVLIAVPYFCLGFIIRAAFAHLSSDEIYLYRFVFPIHSLLFVRVRITAWKFSLPKIDSPWTEVIGFTCFSYAFIFWHQHREVIEALLRRLVP